MRFIDSYKRLEKLCGEVLNDDRRISAYIDEMLNIPSASSFVEGWNDDLKQLKHYRWIRNQIVHDPECHEESMFESNDVLWLDNFYSRIINQTDPLALYEKAVKLRQSRKSQRKVTHSLVVLPTQCKYNQSNESRNKTSTQSRTYAIFFIFILVIVLTLLLLF